MSGSKHPRGFISAYTESDTMQALEDDTLLAVATFVDKRDLCTLGCVCRQFAPLPSYDFLWERHALAIVRSHQQLHAVMTALDLSSNRQLVEVFQRIGIPRGVLGLWQADGPTRSWSVHSSPPLPHKDLAPAEETLAQGELLRLSLVAGGFLCESVAPNGTSHCIFAIRASTTPKGNIKLGFFKLEDDCFATMGGHHWTPGQSIREAFLERASAIPSAKERTPIRPAGETAFLLDRGDGRTRRYSMIEAPSISSQPTSLHPQQGQSVRIAKARDLCGLWCAPYGSHGFEIIHISLDPPSHYADVPGLVERMESISEQTSVHDHSPAVSTCSSGQITPGGSGYTSAPATESSESGFGGSCTSMESDDSGGKEERRREGPVPVIQRTYATTSSRNFDGRGGKGSGSGSSSNSSSDDFGRHLESDEDEEDIIVRTAFDTRPSDGHDSEVNLVTPLLYGVKVTGDINVPAGKASFVVDLEKEFDPNEELQADTRPVIIFLPTGAVMANLANRRGQIAFWCKGRGRINRIPGRWLPEWVDVDLIGYQPGFRYGFSVIFRQPAHVLRIIMDFERVFDSSQEWPRWPVATQESA